MGLGEAALVGYYPSRDSSARDVPSADVRSARGETHLGRLPRGGGLDGAPRVDNATNANYATAGALNWNAFADPISVQRFVAPGAPIGGWAGVKVRFWSG